jgi:hypothetical protein
VQKLEGTVQLAAHLLAILVSGMLLVLLSVSPGLSSRFILSTYTLEQVTHDGQVAKFTGQRAAHVLALILAVVLSVVLCPVLAPVLTLVLALVLAFVLACILTLILSGVLTIVLAVVLAIVLAVVLRKTVQITKDVGLLAATVLVGRVCRAILVLVGLSALERRYSLFEVNVDTYTTEDVAEDGEVAEIAGEGTFLYNLSLVSIVSTFRSIKHRGYAPEALVAEEDQPGE